MSTKSNLERSDIGKNSPLLYNRIRTTIETAFYRNNVVKVTSLAQAYELAKNSSGTIVSDLEVYKATELGLPSDAKVLIYNDGTITGRQAKVRQLIDNDNTDHYSRVLRNSIFNSRNK
jgi:phosphoenolpyruvate carboxykinase (ATP)